MALNYSLSPDACDNYYSCIFNTYTVELARISQYTKYARDLFLIVFSFICQFVIPKRMTF